MVVVSLFIIHHVVCGECVCVSETGPRLLPAHYSLAVLHVCVCARVGCVHGPYWLSARRRDPHYRPHTVTSICFPPSFFFSACHALQWAPSIRCSVLTPSEKEIGKHIKSLYQTKRENSHGGNMESRNIWVCPSWKCQQVLGRETDLLSDSEC